MDTYVIIDARYHDLRLPTGVVRAPSPEDAVQLSRQKYDVPEYPEIEVVMLDSLDEGRMAFTLRACLSNVSNFVLTTEFEQQSPNLTPSEAKAALERLATWVEDQSQPHPWVRPRTAYDDKAGEEVDHWIEEYKFDLTDKTERRVVTATRREVLARYEAARVSGGPVPDHFEMPAALTEYLKSKRSLYQQLAEKKHHGEPVEITAEAVRRLVKEEYHSLFDVALLFGVPIRKVCELVLDEQPARGRRPRPSAVLRYDDKFEEFISDVDMGAVERQLAEINPTPSGAYIPMSARTSVLFSLLRTKYGQSAPQFFATLVETVVAFETMAFTTPSRWSPESRALLELAQRSLRQADVPDMNAAQTSDNIEHAIVCIEELVAGRRPNFDQDKMSRALQGIHAAKALLDSQTAFEEAALELERGFGERQKRTSDD